MAEVGCEIEEIDVTANTAEVQVDGGLGDRLKSLASATLRIGGFGLGFVVPSVLGANVAGASSECSDGVVDLGTVGTVSTEGVGGDVGTLMVRKYNPDNLDARKVAKRQPALVDDGKITTGDIGKPVKVLGSCPSSEEVSPALSRAQNDEIKARNKAAGEAMREKAAQIEEANEAKKAFDAKKADDLATAKKAADEKKANDLRGAAKADKAEKAAEAEKAEKAAEKAKAKDAAETKKVEEAEKAAEKAKAKEAAETKAKKTETTEEAKMVSMAPEDPEKGTDGSNSLTPLEFFGVMALVGSFTLGSVRYAINDPRRSRDRFVRAVGSLQELGVFEPLDPDKPLFVREPAYKELENDPSGGDLAQSSEDR